MEKGIQGSGAVGHSWGKPGMQKDSTCPHASTAGGPGATGCSAGVLRGPAGAAVDPVLRPNNQTVPRQRTGLPFFLKTSTAWLPDPGSC